MKITRIILISLLVLVAVAVITLGPTAWKITAGLRTPVAVPAPETWPTQGWQSSTPEEQGFDSEKMAQGLLQMQADQVNIDSLLIIRNGYVVLDAHFAPYDGKFPHDLASVTKSVMTTLIAIASEQGKLDLDSPVVSFFPEHSIANLDERKEAMTVRHLVSMRNGMQSGCYEGDEDTLEAMRATADWVQAALDRPMVARPGSKFCYDSPGMHLLSVILQQATGMTALDFARQHLFEPLGIQAALWDVDPQGHTRGWGDLHLLPEDAAKIGLLWLQRGNWDGQQIVSEDWVLDSVKTHSKFTDGDFGYGYGWWISIGDYLASGRGGQAVRVMSVVNTILVVTGDYYDYGAIEDWLLPMLLTSLKPVPANPEGLAALQAAVATTGKDRPEWSTSPIPETAAAISGKTFLCQGNPASIESLMLQFDGSPQAVVAVKIAGEQEIMPIGLDGSYRQLPDGWSYRGYWADERTFNFEAFDIGLLSRQVVFDGNAMQISIPEAGLTVTCQVQDS
jgi:CubicO group peptidase (beta-lactamase class C family)